MASMFCVADDDECNLTHTVRSRDQKDSSGQDYSVITLGLFHSGFSDNI